MENSYNGKRNSSKQYIDNRIYKTLVRGITLLTNGLFNIVDRNVVFHWGWTGLIESQRLEDKLKWH